MAKFGISKNVRKGNCVCARAALEQESGQATASEFELDLHTTSTRKHQKQSYGYVWHLEKCKTSKLLLFCARAALEQERGQAMTSEFELDLHTTSTRKHQKQSYVAKFGISKNVRKANCFCARAALEQERGQATASEFELDLHTTSTRKHQKQSYG